MKKHKTPVVRVNKDDYKKILSGEKHSVKVPLTKRLIRKLPPAYESVTGTMLVFPKSACPKQFAFKPRWQFWEKPAIRKIVNIIAIKEEDMSETIRFTLK